ncbi:MAG: hypothetical protein JWR26_3871 [Pedosphaera sp.]|nr:hypothetical protein [Pedosphaera sp.]
MSLGGCGDIANNNLIHVLTAKVSRIMKGDFGADAKEAVPVPVGLLGDPDEDLGSAVEKSLKRIDPEAAAKAGVK